MIFDIEIEVRFRHFLTAYKSRIEEHLKPTHSWPFSSKFHHWGHAKKGGRGTKKESEPKPTAEDLDKEMDDYMKARSK